MFANETGGLTLKFCKNRLVVENFLKTFLWWKVTPKSFCGGKSSQKFLWWTGPLAKFFVVRNCDKIFLWWKCPTKAKIKICGQTDFAKNFLWWTRVRKVFVVENVCQIFLWSEIFQKLFVVETDFAKVICGEGPAEKLFCGGNRSKTFFVWSVSFECHRWSFKRLCRLTVVVV